MKNELFTLAGGQKIKKEQLISKAVEKKCSF